MRKLKWQILIGCLVALIIGCSARVELLPLSQLEKSITAEEFLKHINTLTTDEMAGRGTGQAGGNKAAEYIAGIFKQLGLKTPHSLRGEQQCSSPVRDDRSDYFQEFRAGEFHSRNVVGIIPANAPQPLAEYILIGAHYDHLGATRQPNGSPVIYYGADDNASGVAGLLCLAKALVNQNNLSARGGSASGTGKQEKDCYRRRNLVFVAFGAEEIGCHGSEFYVKNPVVPLDKTLLMLNLDMIGRNDTNCLMCACAGSGVGLDKLVQESAMNLAINVQIVKDEPSRADHSAFYQHRIPVIFFCNAGHPDMHKPSDTAEKIQPDYGVEVIKLAGLCILNALNRDSRFVFAEIKQAASIPSDRTSQPRLGIKPDFTYAGGDGLRIEQVTAGGPAQKAGIQQGDIIILIEDQTVTSLAGYTNALKKCAGQKQIKLRVRRGDQEREFICCLDTSE